MTNHRATNILVDVTGQRIDNWAMETNLLVAERDRLTVAIDANTYRDQHLSLYAARQALSWAINPESAKAPFAMIMESAGIQEAPEGYLGESRPRSS